MKRALVVAVIVVVAVAAAGGYFAWRERADRYAGLTEEQARVQAATFLRSANPGTSLVMLGAAQSFDGITGQNAWQVRFGREATGDFTSISSLNKPDCVVYVRSGVSHFGNHNRCVKG